MGKHHGNKKKAEEPVPKPVVNSTLSEYAQKSAEMLLVGSASADPFSTIVVDPKTGVSAWSYKGSELQGAASGSVAPLGVSGEYLIVAIKDRPLVHCLAIHNRDRFHVKSVVTGPISSFCSSRDGSLFFAAINNQVFIWLLTTGELLSVVDAHYQTISHIGLSDDQSILVTAANDGAVHVYLVSELVSANRERNVNPLHKWRAHSLAVRGFCISHGREPRIVTCGLDHIATVHSISLDTCLLKVSADRPLTACALDPAESRLFLGCDLGNIVQVNLYDAAGKVDMLVQTSDERNSKVPVFNGHSDEISVLAVSGDGAMLASGDISGKYCLWEIGSRQCLRVSTMRGPISSLAFLPNWPTFSANDYTSVWRPVFDLQRNPTSGAKIQLRVRRKEENDPKKWHDLTSQLLQSVVSASRTPISVPTVDEPMETTVENGEKSEKGDDAVAVIMDKESASNTSKDSDNVDERIKELMEENAKLRKINAELYAFSAQQILGDK